MSALEPKLFADLIHQLTSMGSDKDRMRLLRNAIREEHNLFTCKQVHELIEVMIFGPAKAEAAVESKRAVVDQEKYQQDVIDGIKYKDERDAIVAALKENSLL